MKLEKNVIYMVVDLKWVRCKEMAQEFEQWEKWKGRLLPYPQQNWGGGQALTTHSTGDRSPPD